MATLRLRPSRILCPPWIPEHRILRAVGAIRHLRGVDGTDGFPADLGCETQLYLGVALFWAYPEERVITVAGCCGVDAPDAYFFAELLELAIGGGWMKPGIIAAAGRALKGVSAFRDPRPRRAADRAAVPSLMVLGWPPATRGVA